MSYSLESFLNGKKSYIVDLESIEDITEQEKEEAAEASASVDVIRQELDAASSDYDRLSATTEELETQEEIANEIASRNGGKLPEETAAMLETSRRIAAASVGIDPDSEEGKRVISSESIVSRVDGTYYNGFSLEAENEKKEGIIAKIKDTLIKIWEWIKEKVKAFVSWISKIFTFIPKRFKDVIKKLESVSEDDFKKVLDRMVSRGYKSKALKSDGTIHDLTQQTEKVDEFINKRYGGFFGSLIAHYKLYSADTTDDLKTKEKYILEVKKSAESKLNNWTVVLDGTGFFTTTVKDDNSVEIVDDYYISAREDGPYTPKQGLTKADVINALSIGMGVGNKIDNLSKNYSVRINDSENMFNKIVTDSKSLNNLTLKYFKNSTAVFTALVQRLVKQEEALITFAKQFLPAEKGGIVEKDNQIKGQLPPPPTNPEKK